MMSFEYLFSLKLSLKTVNFNKQKKHCDNVSAINLIQSPSSSENPWVRDWFYISDGAFPIIPWDRTPYLNKLLIQKGEVVAMTQYLFLTVQLKSFLTKE